MATETYHGMAYLENSPYGREGLGALKYDRQNRAKTDLKTLWEALNSANAAQI